MALYVQIINEKNTHRKKQNGHQKQNGCQIEHYYAITRPFLEIFIDYRFCMEVCVYCPNKFCHFFTHFEKQKCCEKLNGHQILHIYAITQPYFKLKIYKFPKHLKVPKKI